MGLRVVDIDPMMKQYEKDIELRMENYKKKKKELVGKNGSLSDFANGHHYYGFHQTDKGWYYREWAPGADEMYLMGDFNGWDKTSHKMKKVKGGNFEIFVPGKDTLYNGCRVKAVVHHNGEVLERIPSYAKRVVQDPETIVWTGEIVAPEKPYKWKKRVFHPKKPLMIYECHIGMAQEKYGVGTYKEFTENVLPRVAQLGYNTIQIMAIMEHPYYGSFGYQVSNFFAASSRFGSPDDLKELIDTAHGLGIAVLLDVVHSHAVKNTAEGINQFDGTDYQYFHEGPKGDHSAWGTKCFNYGKNEVIHFLLSNLKFWMTEYRFDGFRFDGITSMLYHHHGLGVDFVGYDKYFSMNTDTEAVTYLQLANELIHEINPEAISIAEDTSAMPGLSMPIADGGIGFDYRMAMGEPDMWIKILKTLKDEQWDLWNIWYELVGRRPEEPVIGYVESHDQALVGDKTVMFRLCDKEMYWSMDKASTNMVVERGIALHKIIRLLTLSLGGEGYLNFMGNEFGHPEWIDFPREGNDWSYHYCRRQWSLADNGYLKYEWLGNFDKQMIAFAKKSRLLTGTAQNLYVHQDDKVLAYQKRGQVFIYNLHPEKSFDGYFIPVPRKGDYTVILSTDDTDLGGQGRISKEVTYTAYKHEDGRVGFKIYLPSRTACVLKHK